MHKLANQAACQKEATAVVNPKVVLLVVSMIMACVGLIIMMLLLRGGLKIFDTYSWEPVIAKVSSYEIVRDPDSRDDEKPYSIRVRYSYSYRERRYMSSTFTLSMARFYSYEDALYDLVSVIGDVAKSITIPQIEVEATCFVNNTKPAESFLKHDSLWKILAFLIPIFGGAVVILACWKLVALHQSDGRGSLGKRKARPEAKIVLGFVFSAMGLSTVYLTGNIITQIETKFWKPVEATIISSSLLRKESKGDEGGTTYKPDIFYHYKFQGRDYRASRYDYIDVSTSQYSSVEAIVKAYPRGTRVSAWVDVNAPERVVLSQALSWNALLYLLPYLFLLFGLGLLIDGLKKLRAELLYKRNLWSRPQDVDLDSI